MVEQEENVFEQMEAEGPSTTEQEVTQPANPAGEVNFDELSSTAVGDQKKYVRADLNGQTVTIERAQLFNANPEKDEKEKSMNGQNEYYRNTFILWYKTENKDREYLSGVRQFVQRDGSLSPHSFWYEGANSQIANLWEKVAAFKKMSPDELSPKEFMAFLNNSPKVKLEAKQYQFPGQKPVSKNVVAEFVA